MSSTEPFLTGFLSLLQIIKDWSGVFSLLVTVVVVFYFDRRFKKFDLEREDRKMFIRERYPQLLTSIKEDMDNILYSQSRGARFQSDDIFASIRDLEVSGEINRMTYNQRLFTLIKRVSSEVVPKCEMLRLKMIEYYSSVYKKWYEYLETKKYDVSKEKIKISIFDYISEDIYMEKYDRALDVFNERVKDMSIQVINIKIPDRKDFDKLVEINKGLLTELNKEKELVKILFDEIFTNGIIPELEKGIENPFK